MAVPLDDATRGCAKSPKDQKRTAIPPPVSPPFLFFVSLFFDMFCVALVTPFMTDFARTVNPSLTFFGATQALYGVMQVISTPLLARVADRIGPLPVLFLSQAGTSVSYGLQALAILKESAFAFTASRCLIGAIRQSMMAGSAYAVMKMGTTATIDQRSIAFANIGLACALGFSAGATLGGYVLEGATSPTWLQQTFLRDAVSFVSDTTPSLTVVALALLSLTAAATNAVNCATTLWLVRREAGGAIIKPHSATSASKAMSVARWDRRNIAQDVWNILRLTPSDRTCGGDDAEDDRPASPIVRTAARRRRLFVTLILSIYLTSFCFITLQNYGGVSVKGAFPGIAGASSFISTMTGASSFVSVLSQSTAVTFGSRYLGWSSVQVALALLVVKPIAAMALATATSPQSMLYASVAMSASSSVVDSVQRGVFSSVFPSRAMGAAMGILASMDGVNRVLAPLIAGSFAEWTGSTWSPMLTIGTHGDRLDRQRGLVAVGRPGS